MPSWLVQHALPGHSVVVFEALAQHPSWMELFRRGTPRCLCPECREVGGRQVF
jgi:hypothetical protein